MVKGRVVEVRRLTVRCRVVMVDSTAVLLELSVDRVTAQRRGMETPYMSC